MEYSLTVAGNIKDDGQIRLNPYSNGILSDLGLVISMSNLFVLILILMEYSLT